MQIVYMNVLIISGQEQSMLDHYLKIDQALANFQGQEKFKQFSLDLRMRYDGAKILDLMNNKIEDDEHQTQIALFLAILNHKHQKIKQGVQHIAQQEQAALVEILYKLKPKILKKIDETEQVYKDYVMSVTNAVNFQDKMKHLVRVYQSLIYQTVLTICDKQQNGIFFKSKSQYNGKQLKKLGVQFKQSIHFMDYDEIKQISEQFSSPQIAEIYVIRIKDKYMFLYPKAAGKIISKQSMRVVNSGQISTAQLANIFDKKYNNSYRSSQQVNGDQRQSFVDEISINDRLNESASLMSSTRTQGTPLNRPQNNHQPTNQTGQPILKLESIPEDPLKKQTTPASQSSIRDSRIVVPAPSPSTMKDVRQSARSSIGDSILFCTKVKCTKCEKTISQLDCISWNYNYYCFECLNDVNVDTSDIPAPRINKFLRQRNITNWSYKLPCAQCAHITTIHNYTPASKPKLYQCELCKKLICIQHKRSIYNCFCYCMNCKIPTIFLQRLNVNFCQQCRFRYCFKCNKSSKQYCKCICKYCLSQGGPKHECQPQCHCCNNVTLKMKTCRCGLFICYGCYYSVLEKFNATGGNFSCGDGEYV